MTTNVAASRVGELFAQHAATLYGYCARRVGQQRAEDLVAEVFVVALRRQRELSGLAVDPLAWLYGIATNVVRRHRRDEIRAYRILARTGVDPLGDATGVVEGHEDSSAERADASRTMRRLAGCLAALPARQREVLLLFAVAELSYAQIASALDIPIGTVQSALHRARQRMRDALAEGDHR